MKTKIMVLAAIVLAGGSAVFWLLNRTGASSMAALPGRSPVASGSATTPGIARGAATADSAGLRALFAGSDMAAIRDALRRAGVPEADVVAFVEMRLMAQASARYRMQASRTEPPAEYWKQSPSRGTLADVRLNQALLRGVQSDLALLFGPEAVKAPDTEAARYEFVPLAKRGMLARIDSDYAQLAAVLAEEARGFRTAADAEKLALLEQEYRRDLEALLSPAELADYDLRISSSARGLRSQFGRFDLSEEEYKRLFATQRAFDAAQAGKESNRAEVSAVRQRLEAEKQLLQQFKAALGDERYAEWERSNTNENRLLQAAAQRFGLSQQTVQTAYEVGPSTVAEAERIANSTGLTREQKVQALQALGQKTRQELTTLLGPEIARAYLANGALTWLRNFEAGVGVAMLNGRVVNRRLDDGP
jgi:hypothetical protein